MLLEMVGPYHADLNSRSIKSQMCMPGFGQIFNMYNTTYSGQSPSANLFVMLSHMHILSRLSANCVHRCSFSKIMNKLNIVSRYLQACISNSRRARGQGKGGSLGERENHLKKKGGSKAS